MLTIFDADLYRQHFPNQALAWEILREIDRVSPVLELGENYNHRDIRASEDVLFKVLGSRSQKELQSHLQPISDGIVKDVNRNLDLMRNLYLGIGEGFYIMDRLDLYILQGASTLYGVYEYRAKNKLPPLFDIGHSQAAKFRQIYWTGLRLRMAKSLNDEDRQQIFEAFKDYDNKDKIYHSATFMTPLNYTHWIDFALDENVTLDEVKSVAKGGRKLLATEPDRHKLTPQYIIDASKKRDDFELPKTLYLVNVNDTGYVVKKITEATTKDHVIEIRDGLTDWLDKN